MTESILFKVEHQVAQITLHRPKVFNSFNREMALALQQCLGECSSNADIRAVYLTGSGRAFCAGQDLQEATSESFSFKRTLQEHYNPTIWKIRQLEKPVVCGVNGVAAGAGANLAFSCDITIAKTSASFTQAFSKIGLIPDSAGTFHLPRIIGMQRATALMFLSDKITAQEAADMGLIYKVLPDENFDAEGLKLAQKLAQMPTKALGLTKRALNQSFSNNLAAQLQVEAELQIEAANSYDYQEGVQAFLEKRKPVFKGE